MASKFMQAFISNAVHDCNELLPAVMNRQVGFKTILAFCQSYRVLAIGLLFSFGDTGAFQSYLYKSARAFLYFLDRADDEVKVTSRFKPFFDAVAALDFDGAREIAARARTTRSDVEYEEDFLFVRFLMIRFFAHVSDDEEQALLDRWEAALEGSEDPRLDVCRGLFKADRALFHDGLGRWIDELEERNNRLAAKEVLSMEEAATEAKLSVEALALVVLAERAGIKTRKNYLFVPSLARAKTPPSAPPDAWTIVTD